MSKNKYRSIVMLIFFVAGPYAPITLQQGEATNMIEAIELVIDIVVNIVLMLGWLSAGILAIYHSIQAYKEDEKL